jgi:hypothetical protein
MSGHLCVADRCANPAEPQDGPFCADHDWTNYRDEDDAVVACDMDLTVAEWKRLPAAVRQRRLADAMVRWWDRTEEAEHAQTPE